MIYLESEIIEKENEILMMEYDHNIENIMTSFIFEEYDTESSSESGFVKLVTSVKKKIKEIIEAIKKFFADLKTKQDLKKLNQAIQKAAASNATVDSSIDADAICKNISILISKSEDVQKSITKYTNDLSSGKITPEQFDKLVNDELSKFDEASNKLESNTKKSFFKKLTSVKDVAKNAKKVSTTYENACDKVQKTSVDEENKMDDMSDKNPNAAMRGANAHSKASKKIAIALLSVAGIYIIRRRAESVWDYNYKLFTKYSDEKIAAHNRYMSRIKENDAEYDKYAHSDSETEARAFDKWRETKLNNSDQHNKEIEDIEKRYRSQRKHIIPTPHLKK